ncbi:hypothetical protein Back11_45350 [Paenibacillus baekrokdamisoli]|uniref:Uncharacterized protein n=1 Tax=Paenibacillus baekrokdamisoli TaxID=1712516 RepID=A0A3G9IWG2_9BACL|nr:class I SAM-dependent methyltransferase [Paenibacillus baekrokdamisoli]MBB3072320.1 ubiquinone/menaquinone biosynthesis C-methylase UbiE [Paenibacillus baekrokdamisoli]BBH23190.1 hypothetical protein Back11_45350 [Paenibacillus baekrokdamisoli]
MSPTLRNGSLKDNQYGNASNFNARIYLHAKFSTNAYPWPCWIWDQWGKLDHANVLELGCGSGLIWKANGPRIPANWTITLSDYSEGMLSAAQAGLEPLGFPFHYEAIDAIHIPYPDESFDLVIANHMLYHLNDMDRKRALEEIHRVLKPSGFLCSSTIGIGNMREMKELVHAFDPQSCYERVLGAIESRFSLDNGGSQLRELFENVELRRYDNKLIVTEPDALVNYLLSVNGLEADTIVLHPDKASAFRQFVESYWVDGSFTIATESGLFLSYKNPV